MSIILPILHVPLVLLLRVESEEVHIHYGECSSNCFFCRYSRSFPKKSETAERLYIMFINNHNTSSLVFPYLIRHTRPISVCVRVMLITFPRGGRTLNTLRLLNDRDNTDTELLIYASTLINKTLSGLSDQDSFYDESDLLEQQGMERIIRYFTSQSGIDLELLDQLQLYDAVLK